jgi:hypothetical protein
VISLTSVWQNSPFMSALWQSNDPEEWLKHLEASSDRLEALRAQKLTQLDEYIAA